MPSTFGMIDNNSGFLFGVLDGDDPIAACRTLDESIRVHGRRYAAERIEGTTRTGYYVHDVTGILASDEDLDGQDGLTIARAERGKLVAQVACYDTTT